MAPRSGRKRAGEQATQQRWNGVRTPGCLPPRAAWAHSGRQAPRGPTPLPRPRAAFSLHWAFSAGAGPAQLKGRSCAATGRPTPSGFPAPLQTLAGEKLHSALPTGPKGAPRETVPQNALASGRGSESERKCAPGSQRTASGRNRKYRACGPRRTRKPGSAATALARDPGRLRTCGRSPCLFLFFFFPPPPPIPSAFPAPGTCCALYSPYGRTSMADIESRARSWQDSCLGWSFTRPRKLLAFTTF